MLRDHPFNLDGGGGGGISVSKFDLTWADKIFLKALYALKMCFCKKKIMSRQVVVTFFLSLRHEADHSPPSPLQVKWMFPY